MLIKRRTLLAAAGASTLAAPAIAQGIQRRQAADGGVTVPCAITSPGAALASSISMRADVMSARRFLQSFSRQRRSNRRIDGGVLAGRACQSGSFVSTNASV